MTNAANEMGVFERVIERGSFAAAAEDVGLSPSAVSKLVARLEQRLGVRLINRTTRSLALTAEGKIYVNRSREILAAIEATEAEIASARLSPSGRLRVQAPPVMSSLLIRLNHLQLILIICPSLSGSGIQFMDFADPPVDFTGMAKSLGLEAIRVTDPAELKSAFASAFSRPGTKLIEVVVNNAVN